MELTDLTACHPALMLKLSGGCPQLPGAGRGGTCCLPKQLWPLGTLPVFQRGEANESLVLLIHGFNSVLIYPSSAQLT